MLEGRTMQVNVPASDCAITVVLLRAANADAQSCILARVYDTVLVQ